MLTTMVPDPSAPTAVPPGWEMLPRGVLRQLRVCREEVGRADGRPWEVITGDDTPVGYAEVKILGPSWTAHRPGPPALARLETCAALLVRRG